MTKQPLHNIDSLFQQKLEELPVDVSQQQAQWLSLSQIMQQPPKGGLWQKPWLKWAYMILVAWVPFAVFYFTYQPPVAVSPASRLTPACVTRSLSLFETAGKSAQTNNEAVTRQTVIPPGRKQQAPSVRPATIAQPTASPASTIQVPNKSKDSAQAAPIRKEQPKKADSSYIYWQ